MPRRGWGGRSLPRPISPFSLSPSRCKVAPGAERRSFWSSPVDGGSKSQAGGIGRRRCLTLNSPAAGRRSPPPFPALTSAPGPVGLLLDFPRSCCKTSHAATTQRGVLGALAVPQGRNNALSTHIGKHTEQLQIHIGDLGKAIPISRPFSLLRHNSLTADGSSRKPCGCSLYQLGRQFGF